MTVQPDMHPALQAPATRGETIASLSWSDDLHLFTLPKLFASACGDPAGWTDAELALMVGFSQRRQTDYRVRCGSSRFDWQDNFITVMREDRDGRIMWSRKRLSWKDGAYWSPSLPEAIATFDKDDWRDIQGRHVLTVAGDMARIEARTHDGFQAPLYHDTEVVRLRDGARFRISSSRDILIVAGTLAELASSMRMAVEHRISSAYQPSEEEASVSRAAFTEKDDPILLERMWTSRVWSLREKDAPTSAVRRAA